MERPSEKNHADWQAKSPVGSPTNGEIAPIAEFVSANTEWHRHILEFLQAHPESSLLTIVHHLWPEFLNLPTDRRARAWFWTKDQLHILRSTGVVKCKEDESGVGLWSIL